MQDRIGERDFPARDESAYLNTASVALVVAEANEAMEAWQRRMVESGTLDFDEAAEAAVFDELHEVSARLLNARPDDMAVGSSATEMLASLAWAVMPGAGSNVVGTEVVFPTTIYPWMRVARHTGCEVRLVAGCDGRVRIEDLVDRIDDDTAVVCLSHVEYGSGQLFDLDRLVEAAHGHDALLVVDATQSAGAVPIDVARSEIDVLVTSGYKWLCGPFGVALMYLSPRLHGALDPGIVGFRSHHDMWDLKADRLRLPDTARRFEFSTMAYGCALALTRSIDYLLRIGIEDIFNHNLGLADRLVEGLRERGVDIVSPLVAEERTSIVSVRFPDGRSPDVARHLNRNRVVVSPRGDLVRFSPHLYNRAEDIDRALDVIDRYEA